MNEVYLSNNMISLMINLLASFLLWKDSYDLMLFPSIRVRVRPFSLFMLTFILTQDSLRALTAISVVLMGKIIHMEKLNGEINWSTFLTHLKTKVLYLNLTLLIIAKSLFPPYIHLPAALILMVLGELLLNKLEEEANTIWTPILNSFLYLIMIITSITSIKAILSYFLWIGALIWVTFETITHKLLSAYDEVIKVIGALASALELRDVYTYQHSYRVSHFAKVMAKELGLPKKMIDKLVIAGKIHDLGKLLIPNRILNKTSRLTDEEYEEIKKHVIYTGELLKEIEPYFRDEIRFALTHHEKWDGSGYPYGLKGEEIPLGGRILGIVDTFDALITDRPYKRGVSVRKALSIIEGLAGKDFDPELVKVFIKSISSEEVLEVIREYRVRLQEYQAKMLKMLEGAFDSIRLLALKDAKLLSDLFPKSGLFIAPPQRYHGNRLSTGHRDSAKDKDTINRLERIRSRRKRMDKLLKDKRKVNVDELLKKVKERKLKGDSEKGEKGEDRTDEQHGV